jgi:hypothetical protein
MVRLQRSNACVFCGDDESGLTLEHVFSDWISDVLEVRGKAGSNTRFSHEAKSPVQWGGRAFQWKVKVLCFACNNKWLGQVEGQVKSILGPMIVGQPTQLNVASQRLLSFWAVKTALMANHLQPLSEFVPKSHYERLYATGKPPRGTRVWIGHRTMPADTDADPLGDLAFGHVTKLDDPYRDRGEEIVGAISDGHRMYRCTFGIGCVVFQVFGHDMPFDVDIVASPTSPLVQIWPAIPPFEFPNGLGIEMLGGLRALDAFFDRKASSAEWSGTFGGPLGV